MSKSSLSGGTNHRPALAGRRNRRNVLAIVLGALGCVGCLAVLFSGVLFGWLGIRGGVIPALPFLYTPTPTPSPTATPLPWDLNLLDDFSQDVSRWPIITDRQVQMRHRKHVPGLRRIDLEYQLHG